MIGATLLTRLGENLEFKQRNLREKVLFFVMLAFYFFLPVSVSGSQIALAVGFLLILPEIIDNPRHLFSRPFMIPLGLFVLFSLGSVLMSTNMLVSLEQSKNLLLLLVIPLVIHATRNYDELKIQITAMAASSFISAATGFYQVFTGSGGGTHGYRLTGALGHYMTAGGVFLFFSLLMLSVTVFITAGRSRYLAGALSLLSITAMLLTQSRNAYVGMAFALVALFLTWKRQLVFFLPFVLSLAVLLSPPIVRDRMFHIVDLQDATVQARISMMETGLSVVSDFPLFGIGPGQVEVHYDHYKEAMAPGGVPHLHNNLLQIAAEKGLPALAAWLWMIYSIAKAVFITSQDNTKERWRHGLACASFAIIVAMFTAGMFEYNFGDTEVQMFFWAVVFFPFAAVKTSTGQENES